MLLKQLSDEDRRLFLGVAELLVLCDKHLLWNGQRRDDSVQNSRSGTLSLQRGQAAQALEELASTLLGTMSVFEGRLVGGPARARVQGALVERIEALPLYDEDDPVVRVGAATDLLREMLKDKRAAVPSVPKLMLFELFMLALADGSISTVQWQVLSEFRHHYQVENPIFDDLLERARCTHREVRKTLAIILE